MSHSSSQWSHVDSNVRKGKDLVTQDTSVSEEKANKLTNKKVEKLQEAAEPPAQEEIRLEGTVVSRPRGRNKVSESGKMAAVYSLYCPKED
jgi:hypothetical protein